MNHQLTIQWPYQTSHATAVPPSLAQVTPELRVQAKRLAYGMLYGMGTSTLAAELGVSVQEAAELSDNFRRALPGVDRWTREVRRGRISLGCPSRGEGENQWMKTVAYRV